MASDPRVAQLRKLVRVGGPFPEGFRLDAEDAESVIRGVDSQDPLRLALREPRDELLDTVGVEIQLASMDRQSWRDIARQALIAFAEAVTPDE